MNSTEHYVGNSYNKHLYVSPEGDVVALDENEEFLGALTGGLTAVQGIKGLFGGSSGPDPKDVPFINMRENYFRMIEAGNIEEARREYNRIKPLKNWKYLPTVEQYAAKKGLTNLLNQAFSPQPQKVGGDYYTNPTPYTRPDPQTGQDIYEPKPEEEKTDKVLLYGGIGLGVLLVIGILIAVLKR
ncbi:hypothetical protein [Ekhidna sp.]|jgi:hypothetical protein|uniref:hypothetical protein n=1 Tax=Ekhidna sp. TaxID=2608089 RepID=UPI0032EBA2EA